MTWHDDLVEHIVANFTGHGTWVAGKSVVVGPPKDDDTVDDMVIGLAGRPGPVDETFERMYGRPNLTLIVRSAAQQPRAAMDCITDLFVFLTQIANETIGQTTFLRLKPEAWPDRLRLDEKMRTDFTAEIGVWLDEH